MGSCPRENTTPRENTHLGKRPHKDRIWSMTDLVNQDKVASDLKGLLT